jgi:Predicted membrane protein (DUF2335)
MPSDAICAPLWIGMVHSASGRSDRRIAQQSSPKPDIPVDLPPEVEQETLEPAVEILRPLLRDPNQAPQTVAKMAVQLFRGPLPPPDHFKGYNDVVPGSAREILDMARGEQAHRHRMQILEMFYPYLGWFAGFVGFLACIGGAAYLATNGHDAVAGGMLGVPCLGVIGWFIRSRLSPGEEPPASATQKRAAPQKRRR